MFSFTKSFTKKESRLILVLSVYKSHISAKFIDTKNAKKLRDFKFTLNYLRTFSPKYELEKEAVRSAVHDLSKRLAELSVNLGLSLANLREIYIVNHASLSKLKVNEFFVKLDKSITLNKNVLLNILLKHYAEEESFKETIFGKYVKTTKVISKVKPLYYDIKNWENKSVSEFSVILNQVYADKEFSIQIKDALLEQFPDREIIFLHSVLFLLDLHEGSNSSVIVNIGAESMSAFQLYKDQVVDNRNIDFGVNHLVRELEKKLNLSFELSASQLAMFLKGECKADYCSVINKAKEEFVLKIKDEFKLSEFKKDLTDCVKFIFNPSIEQEIVKFLANSLSLNIGKDKQYEILDFSDILDSNLHVFNNFVHKQDFLLML